MTDLYKALDDNAIMTKIICNLPTEYDYLGQCARGSMKA